MKQDKNMKVKVERGVYSGMAIFLFAFSLLILAGILLTIGGTAIQLIFN